MGNATYTPQVAISKSFMSSWMDLPAGMMGKVGSFIEKFQRNPQSTGINLEKILNSSDGKMYSTRVTQQYRAVIAHDTASNVYMLLYVGDHDDAYRWAVRKRIEVNSRTNSIQLFDDLPQTAPQDVPYAQQWQGDGYNSSQTSRQSTDSAPHPVPNTVNGSNGDANTLPDDYHALTEEDMRDLGVPEIYVPVMLQQHTRAGLNQWLKHLPEDAQALLQLIAEGQSRSEVLAMARESSLSISTDGPRQTTPSDTANGTTAKTFREALSSLGTQQSFVVVQGEEDLRRLLDSPLEQWRVFLHSSQRVYVENNYHGPFRLLGAAGTGKTVVAMHRAKRLAAKLLRDHSSQKVLFTTYSTNLATDIQSNLRLICTPEEMQVIDVINLDKYVRNYLRSKGYDYDIWYEGGWNKSHRGIDDVWSDAIGAVGAPALNGLSVPFFRDEWGQVIVPQQVSSLADYLHTVRRGRGTRLARAQKIAIWKVVERYQQLMRDEHACDIDMAMSMAAGLMNASEAPKRYAHVIVDEGQDFSAPAYRVLRATVEEHDNDIFIVGDPQQRIYGRTVVLSKCGIRISGRARRLKINYRTTEQTRAAADRIFAASGGDVADSVFAAVSDKLSGSTQPEMFDDLDGQVEPNDDSRSLMAGPEPLVKRFATKKEELDYVEQWLTDVCGKPKAVDVEINGSSDDHASDDSDVHADARDICVVARNGRLVSEWCDALDTALPYGVYQLKRGEEDDRRQPGIRVSTMHRVKGLEFDYVVIVDVEDGVCPPPVAVNNASDDVARREVYKQERSLIYVALTRARKQALLLGRGSSQTNRR